MPEEHKDSTERDMRMATAHLQERREARYTVPIEIEISGVTQSGEVFHERLITRDVSEWGCGFVATVELKADDMIALRVASGDAGESVHARQSLFQVRRVAREGEGWLVGAWKMDNGDVWGADLAKIAKPEVGGLESRKEWSAENGESEARDAER